MAIITISRGSYSKGREIAEKVAEQLGYECIARRILLEASDEFNVPEVKLRSAIHDAPSFSIIFRIRKRNIYPSFKRKYWSISEKTILSTMDSLVISL